MAADLSRTGDVRRSASALAPTQTLRLAARRICCGVAQRR